MSVIDHRKSFVASVEGAWRTRDQKPEELRLTRLHVHVACKLVYWRTTTPKASDLAHAAACSVRTVRRALAILKGLGLLSWTRRVFGCRGWRALVSSRFDFLSQRDLLTQTLRSPANLAPPARMKAPPPPPAVARDLLAERRAATERRILEERRRKVAGWQQPALA